MVTVFLFLVATLWMFGTYATIYFLGYADGAIFSLLLALDGFVNLVWYEIRFEICLFLDLSVFCNYSNNHIVD